MAAAILTVSDSASINPSLDVSGPSVSDFLSNHRFRIHVSKIVPDDIHLIRSTVLAWSLQDDIDWIITTGGTGFGTRDLTPEAVGPLINRHAPGLVHLLLSSSQKHTPFAALSRPVAGTIGNSLVVTLPGSVKAVKESLEALFTEGLIHHAIDLIKGGSGSAVHSSLAASSTPHHHHHHHHHHRYHPPPQRRAVDPSFPVSARHRQSPYPIINLSDAIASVLSHTQVLPIHVQKVSPALKTHILAQDVLALHDLPRSSTTSVDGYALKSSDPPGVYHVLTSQTHRLSDPLPSGSIYRINTGAPLPAGTDAVIMVEDTRLSSTLRDAEGHDVEENQVETLAQVPKGDNVRLPGSDVKAGDLVLRKGDLLSSIGGEIGSLAFVGKKEVEVFRKPVVAILSTGNEIVDILDDHTSDGNWGGVWDTNRPSLQAALEGMGYQVIDLGIVTDDIQSHVERIQKGLETADILLTTGGTSMGPSDLLKPVIERNFNGTIHFGRVKMKPGKPTTFATIPKPQGHQAENVPVFALPGNPASALVTFHLFVVPALRKLGGWADNRCQLPRIRVRLQDSMRLDPRPEFHRVVLRATDGIIEATSTGGQRSSRIASLSGANGLVALPEAVDGGPGFVEAGQVVDAVVIARVLDHPPGYYLSVGVAISIRKKTMVQVTLNGTLLAESNDTIVVENNHYFPQDSVNMSFFSDSSASTFCPWKGTASYYNAVVGADTIPDVAWYYANPYEAAMNIKNYVAFYKNKVVIQ